MSDVVVEIPQPLTGCDWCDWAEYDTFNREQAVKDAGIAWPLVLCERHERNRSRCAAHGMTYDHRGVHFKQEHYAPLESALTARYGKMSPTNKLRAVDDETPFQAMPASWFQHFKWSLQGRFPRLFGWLTVRWNR